MEKQILLVVDSLPETDIAIARQGEANYRTLAIDIKSWLAEYPLGTVSGIFVRADGTSYPVVLTIADGIASWSPTATETTAAGAAQLVLQITSGSVIGRSATIGLRVVESPAAGATPPAVDSPWISAVIDAAATYPYVGDNGHWFTFDGESGLWVDTNVSAKGDKGDKGDKPVKGTDYWTAADKTEIVEDTVEEININPESKTATMTQAVGKDASGKLWTAPGGGGTGDFDELTNRPSYNGSAMTHSTNIPEVKTATWDGKYSKPSGGIPASDMASAVQASLGKADSALQEHQSLAAYRTSAAQDVIDATKQNIPSQITTGTSITLADNTEYRLTDVTTLTLAYPQGSFECWLKISTASEGTISITLPTSSYIGSTPTFGNSETWEISIKDGVVVAGKAVSA